MCILMLKEYMEKMEGQFGNGRTKLSLNLSVIRMFCLLNSLLYRSQIPI